MSIAYFFRGQTIYCTNRLYKKPRLLRGQRPHASPHPPEPVHTNAQHSSCGRFFVKLYNFDTVIFAQRFPLKVDNAIIAFNGEFVQDVGKYAGKCRTKPQHDVGRRMPKQGRTKFNSGIECRGIKRSHCRAVFVRCCFNKNMRKF